ncbi:Mbov_0399 family ICE element protein [Metamycoplasma salivarium]|uniref:Mbov_0399 family ICE element protein n=1 Tax=Metamycoplasma salivarium TaxID=2124 RepID=UPI001F27985A|nr:hypothetical protein [Metamycoplasma salivarium]GIZ06661.1 hypothetical protein MSATCC33130_0150 [Metamycoplasma salivarium]
MRKKNIKPYILLSSALLVSGIFPLIFSFKLKSLNQNKQLSKNTAETYSHNIYQTVKNSYKKLDNANLLKNINKLVFNKQIWNEKGFKYDTSLHNPPFQNKGIIKNLNWESTLHNQTQIESNSLENSNVNGKTWLKPYIHDIKGKQGPLFPIETPIPNNDENTDTLYYRFTFHAKRPDRPNQKSWTEHEFWISPREYNYNFELSKTFNKLVEDFKEDLNIKSVRGTLRFNSDKLNFNYSNDTKIIHGETTFQKAFVGMDEKLKVEFERKKWNGMDIDDFHKLIQFLAKDKDHLDNLKEAFNFKSVVSPISLESDSMGEIDTPIDKNIYIGGISNRERIENKLSTLTKTYQITSNLSVEMGYEIIAKGDSFDLCYKLKKINYKGVDLLSSSSFISNIENVIDGGFQFINDCVEGEDNKTSARLIYLMLKDFIKLNGKKVIENIPIKFTPTEIYIKYSSNIHNRLKFILGSVINENSLYDIQNNPDFNISKNQTKKDEETKMPDDPNDPMQKGPSWGGKYLVNSPLGVDFTGDLDETEVLFINKQRVDVINHKFRYALKDFRKSATDNERIPYQKLEQNEELTLLNSHAKNEYLIEIKKYAPGTNNSGEPIFTYRKMYVINSQSTKQEFKWYAWDPDKNPEQKELITEYLTINGEIQKNLDGTPKLNPKYDPEINKATGTKSQIIWIPKGTLYSNITKHLKFMYPNIKSISNNDLGILAEASVLGKGALRNLFLSKETKNNNTKVKYFKMKIYDKDKLEWIPNDKLKLEELSTNNADSQNAYMSEEGIWLVGSTSEKGISNLKLVMIDKNNSPRSYFIDEIKKYDELSYKKAMQDSNYDYKLNSIKNKFELFWKGTNKLATPFRQYLIEREAINPDTVYSLSYNELLNKYINWVNDSFDGATEDPILQSTNIFGNISEWENNGELGLDGRTGSVQHNSIEEAKAEIKAKIEAYILRNMKRRANILRYLSSPININADNIDGNPDWYIENWVSEELQKLLDKLLEVDLYSKNNSPSTFVELTLKGNNRFRDNIPFKLKVKNYAWHIYDPPYQLGNLNINSNNIFKMELNKDDYYRPNLSPEEIDKSYREAIKEKLKELITEELNKIRINGEEVWLDKDIKIENEELIINQLMRGKQLGKDITFNLIGINANLFGKKEIKIQNSGDGGKFNLSNLTMSLLQNKLYLNTTDPNELISKIKSYIQNEASKLNLKYEEDYLIYGIQMYVYWINLVADLENGTFKNRDELFKLINEARAHLDKFRTLKIKDKNGKDIIIPIEFEPKNQAIANRLQAYYDKCFSEMIKTILSNGNKENLFAKLLVMMPTETTEGFGYGYVFNKVDKSYDVSTDKRWIKGLKNDPNQNDPHGKPETNDEKKKKQIKKTVGISFGVIFGIIAIVGIIFLAKFLSKKYGWTLGKRASKQKEAPRPKKLNIIGAKKSKWTIFKEKVKNLFKSKKNKNINDIK